jgi:hypothetical protein
MLGIAFGAIQVSESWDRWMANEPRELPEVRRLRAEHHAADKAAGLLIAVKGTASLEYLEAEKARSEAWDRLRDALGLSHHFGK